MEKSPLISIIIPVYNVKDYLEKCLHSVCEQTYRNLEIIVIDDGSSDGSGELCDQFASADSRIKVFHQENQGQSCARNKGLAIAMGEYIGFVDSDDWIDSDMYELLYVTLDDNHADIAICGYYLDYKDGNSSSCKSDKTIIYNKAEALELILDDQLIKSYLWDKLFRKELITDLLPNSYYYEDYATLFKWFIGARRVAFCQAPKYHYRQRKGSTDHDEDPEKKYHFFLAEQERYNYLKKHHLLLGKSKDFALKVVLTGLQEAKGIVRNSKDEQKVHQYVRKIREDILLYLPVEYKKLRLKEYLRLLKLVYTPLLYIYSIRISRLFLMGKGRKKKNLYDY